MDENINNYFTHINAPFNVKRILELEGQGYIRMIYLTD